jgi:hypothetical protein
VFDFADTDKLSPRTHPDVGFHLDRIEIQGRPEEGRAPVELSDEDVVVDFEPTPESSELVSATTALVAAAVALAGDEPRTFVQVIAFAMFGLGVSCFESGIALVSDARPVEALAALRGLVVIAARFEQVNADDAGGAGLILRIALDEFDEPTSSDNRATPGRQNLLADAESAGIAIPDDLPESEGTDVFKSLRAEMQMADSAVNGGFRSADLHVTPGESGQVEFHTQLKPGPFTEMVASAFVIAQLELLRAAAKFFGWTLESSALGDLLGRARHLNETSANPKT